MRMMLATFYLYSDVSAVLPSGAALLLQLARRLRDAVDRPGHRVAGQPCYESHKSPPGLEVLWEHGCRNQVDLDDYVLRPGVAVETGSAQFCSSFFQCSVLSFSFSLLHEAVSRC
ncbi:hypothetical protein F5Y15DRAFT_365678 [Xylariaceae sp. FL0016]|nr:hypothetical protein F5Y15DRAFT_365678 [Xylariaceae sp. FL0016]